VAFASTTKGGTVSKIKSILTPGAAVSISRNLADTIITEYGVAELRGRTIRERVDAIISIAHPDFRAQLRKEAKEFGIIV
jgi:acyl-CoA hydrolase